VKVLFRVDAALHIGTGHVIRCLTLATKLSSRGHECEFLCRPFIGNLIERIEAAGFVCHVLSLIDQLNICKDDVNTWLGTNYFSEISEIYRNLSTARYDWIVIDHYGINANWHSAIREMSNRLLVIDDLCQQRLDCDVILNQNCGIDDFAYNGLIDSNVVRLIGSQYALLRDEFSTLRPFSLQRREQPFTDRVFVCMGGVDVANATEVVLSALDDIQPPRQLTVSVVMGSVSPHLDKIRRFETSSRHNVQLHVNPVGIASLMATSDIGIGAAGSTTWERSCLGLPSFQVAVAENQRNVCRYLSSMKAVVGYESVDELSATLPRDFATITNRELIQLSKVSRDLCDGTGSTRVSCLMEEF